MYADDTTIYFNLEDFTHLNIENEINDEIEKITIWLKVNKLSLNVQKNVICCQRTLIHIVMYYCKYQHVLLGKI